MKYSQKFFNSPKAKALICAWNTQLYRWCSLYQDCFGALSSTHKRRTQKSVSNSTRQWRRRYAAAILEGRQRKGKDPKEWSAAKSKYLYDWFRLGWLCALGWTGRRWTQCCNGSFRHDQKVASRVVAFRLFERPPRHLHEQLHGNQRWVHESLQKHRRLRHDT